VLSRFLSLSLSVMAFAKPREIHWIARMRRFDSSAASCLRLSFCLSFLSSFLPSLSTTSRCPAVRFFVPRVFSPAATPFFSYYPARREATLVLTHSRVQSHSRICTRMVFLRNEQAYIFFGSCAIASVLPFRVHTVGSYTQVRV